MKSACEADTGPPRRVPAARAMNADGEGSGWVRVAILRRLTGEVKTLHKEVPS